MKALMKKDKKGFTLVEVIVVLVILAILAAVLVPTLTGYIDRANERALIAETRAAVMAAQTIASENYAKGVTTAPDASAVTTLSELASGSVSSISVDSGKVTALTYTKSGKSCTYSNGVYTAGDTVVGGSVSPATT